MLGRMQEVLVSRQQRQIVPPTELSQEGVDRAELNACPATGVPDLGSFDVIFAVWLKQRQRRELLDELGPGLGPGEPLQQLLKYQTRGDHLFSPKQRVTQHLNVWLRGVRVSAQGQGPDARIDEEAHD